MLSSPEFQDQAHAAAMEVLIDRDRYGSLRQNAGDVFAGAVAAGADDEAALEVSLLVHTTPELYRSIPSSGGVLTGALFYLEWRGVDG